MTKGRQHDALEAEDGHRPGASGAGTRSRSAGDGRGHETRRDGHPLGRGVARGEQVAEP